ncbi:hypothetical protein BaRGS_00027089 [Batillaria attramentaria]|uniref:GST N-terminal domain-containing protein n=1 Tax=Batillaria attramentaria TaxID=370345 RepID=A0ABD0K331_9CAEN
MDRRVKLYYNPSSSASQKVLVALQEKEVKFEGVIIDIQKKVQQLEAWYMRINPAGAVPVLQDGEKIIRESEDIVDYIDREFPGESKLVPDMSTEMGKEVSRWRKVLNEEVQVFAITYGTMCFPELSASGLKLAKSVYRSKDDIIANMQIRAKRCEQLADEHPDLREAYTAKMSAVQKNVSTIADKDNVVKALDALESTLDKVQEKLKKVDADPSKELWFCGQQFTAADITLCILLGRLDLLGLGERYHSNEKRPKLHAYWQQAKKRPSIHRVSINVLREIMKMKLREGAKTVLPVLGGLVTVGLAAGLAFLFASKR